MAKQGTTSAAANALSRRTQTYQLRSFTHTGDTNPELVCFGTLRVVTSQLALIIEANGYWADRQITIDADGV